MAKRVVRFCLGVLLLVHGLILCCLMWWKFFPVEHSMFMLSYRVQHISKPVKHTWVPYSKINNNLKRALIVGEDARFSFHHGFDIEGIQRAYKRNKKRGRVIAGGSTITQQLAKNLFLFNKRSYIRKAEEAVIAVMIEMVWPKQRILEVYLNSIEFGNGIYGAEAAARHYYKKSASQLSRSEAARLAGLVPNPKYYAKHPYDRKLQRRIRVINRYISYAQLPKKP